MRYDHYDIRFRENKTYIWYISSKGYVYKILKKEVDRNCYHNKIYLSGYIHAGKLVIKVAKNKTMLLKTLVASKFMKNYYPGCCINHKDNNQLNCNIENLYIYSMREHGKLTGYKNNKNKPIIISSNGKTIEYRSSRIAAKDLFVSRETIRDYLLGKVKNSILNGYQIQYKEES